MEAPILDIRLDGAFHLAQLERLMNAVAPLCGIARPHRLRLDLSKLTFISPASLALLSAILAERLSRGLCATGSIYTRPQDRSAADYLADMAFHETFAGAPTAGTFQRRPADGYTPCLWLPPEAEASDIADPLTRAIQTALGLVPKERAAVFLAIKEMAQNVLDHAASPIGGFAAARPGRGRHEFEIAIADAGVGIAKSLRRNADYRGISDDAEAILTALKLGVTSNPPENQGVGLNAVRVAVGENGGTLMVRSGTAAVVSTETRSLVYQDLAAWPGTLVALRLRRDRRFQMSVLTGLSSDSATLRDRLEQEKDKVW